MTSALLFWLPLLAVMVSAVAGIGIFLAGEGRMLQRTTLNLLAAVAKLALIAWMAVFVVAGQVPEFRLPLLPGLDLVLRADALSMLFATLSAFLWLVTTVYAVAYLEIGADRARFFGFFSPCVTATMGISMAGNLLTFFVFYELLTLTTWPRVVHKEPREAYAGARSYLAHTMSASALFLVGMVWLYAPTGPQDFVVGGTLAAVAAEQPGAAMGIFVLLVIGMGVKTALFPLHSWLPRAMVAPAPVSTLLHAVAMVKAGAFGLVHLIEDVFGAELIATLDVGLPLALLAGFTIIYGSVQSDIKKRLAYSTVSQVSHIALGLAIDWANHHLRNARPTGGAHALAPHGGDEQGARPAGRQPRRGVHASSEPLRGVVHGSVDHQHLPRKAGRARRARRGLRHSVAGHRRSSV